MANPASCSRRPAPCPAQPLPRSCPPPTPAHTSAESHPALPRSVLKHQPPGHNVARSEQSTARKHRYQQHRCNATSSSLTPESRRSQRRDPAGQILSPSQDCKGARGFPLPLPLPSRHRRGTLCLQSTYPETLRISTSLYFDCAQTSD